MDLALRKLRDIFRQRLGQNHPGSLIIQDWHCRSLLNQKRYDEAERSLHDLIETFEHFCGRNATSTRNTLYDLARLYYETCRDAEAEDILVDVLQRGKGLGGFDLINILAMRLRGFICFVRGDHRAAEAILWSALSDCLLHYGPRGPETMHSWVEFQRHYEISASLPMSSGALPEIPEESVRCFSRPRSSSLPSMDNREFAAYFCYEAPV